MGKNLIKSPGIRALVVFTIIALVLGIYLPPLGTSAADKGEPKEPLRIVVPVEEPGISDEINPSQPEPDRPPDETECHVTVEVLKLDSVTSSPLAGAKYKLEWWDPSKGPNGSWVEITPQKTTGSDGLVSWNPNKYGKYKVTEVGAPSGYKDANPKSQEKTQNTDGTLSFTFLNEPKQSGTTLSATKTASGFLETTYEWSIEKTAVPTLLNLIVGGSAPVDYFINVTKSTGTVQACVQGYVTVTNGGGVATQNLTITDTLFYKKTGGGYDYVAISFQIDTSAKPILDPGETYSYPYKVYFTPPPDATGYKNTAHVTITNHSGSIGIPFGPAPSYSFSSLTQVSKNEGVYVWDETWNTLLGYTNTSTTYQFTRTLTCTQEGEETVENWAVILDEAGAELDRDDATVTLINTLPSGEVELEKVYVGDAPTDPISFTLTSTDNSYSETKQLTGAGSLSWNDLPWGEYTLSEAVPAGYTVEGLPQTFTIDGEHLSFTFTATNSQNEGSVELEKVYVGDAPTDPISFT
ncbi:MAG: SpaA isopeptide-forming pilin-related protein, partial [Caldiserica bacterium]|nr:SpaA isopeptide-forming pilin-related protein [Caldisericota bacterium]